MVEICSSFCEDTVPGLLEGIKRATMWLPNKRIGRGGPIPRPPRSPDLTPTDFLFMLVSIPLSEIN